MRSVYSQYLRSLALSGLVILGMITIEAKAEEVRVFYAETNVGQGLWQYNYTFVNGIDADLLPGRNLYLVSLDFESDASISILSLPPDWFAETNIGITDFFSGSPGPPPAGSDLAPGLSLGTFSLTVDYRAGDVPFTALISNTADPANPLVFNGTTTPTSITPTSIPEPTTIALFASGLAAVAFSIRRNKLLSKSLQ